MDMLHALRPVKDTDITGLISFFKDVMSLHNWRIKHKLEEDKRMGQSLMKVVPNRGRSMATIYIRQSLVGVPLNEFGPLLLHELMHLVLEPLVEEHIMQLQYEVSEDRLKEYEDRFRKPLEKVVEHLTWQVSPLIQLMPGIYQTRIKVEEQEDRINAIFEYFKEKLEANNDLLQHIAKQLAMMDENSGQ